MESLNERAPVMNATLTETHRSFSLRAAIVRLSMLAVATATLGALPVRADEQSELIQKLLLRIEQLEKKVESHEGGKTNPVVQPPVSDKPAVQELDQKIRALERKSELATEDATAKAREAPRVSVGSGGFALSSADTNFVLKIRGVIQMDTRAFFNDNPALTGNDGFLLRRARPIIEGTVFRDFDFQFVPDFGGGTAQIFDAWLNYRYQPEVQLKLGKFKSPIGLEQLQADVNLNFNERSLATDLVPNRDLGVQIWGDISGGLVSYAAGVFNGIGDARNSSNADFDDKKAVEGRLFFQPFKKFDLPALQGFGFGLGGSYSQVGANATGLPNGGGFVTDGQQQFFAYTNGVVANGEHWRLSPQASYYYGPFGLLGEYAISNQRVSRGRFADRLQNTAWQISGQWILTGEDTSFNGVNPLHPFDPRAGQWGAWQVVGRYAKLDVDNDAFPLFANPSASASSAAAWSVGLNWWLNRNVRILTSFSHTTFDGGGKGPVAPGAVTHQPENVFFTRVQLSF